MLVAYLSFKSLVSFYFTMTTYCTMLKPLFVRLHVVVFLHQQWSIVRSSVPDLGICRFLVAPRTVCIVFDRMMQSPKADELEADADNCSAIPFLYA